MCLMESYEWVLPHQLEGWWGSLSGFPILCNNSSWCLGVTPSFPYPACTLPDLPQVLIWLQWEPCCAMSWSAHAHTHTQLNVQGPWTLETVECVSPPLEPCSKCYFAWVEQTAQAKTERQIIPKIQCNHVHNSASLDPCRLNCSGHGDLS